MDALYGHEKGFIMKNAADPADIQVRDALELHSDHRCQVEKRVACQWSVFTWGGRRRCVGLGFGRNAISAHMEAVAVLVLVLAMNAGCSDGCGNTIVSSKEAPDARHVAVLFQRDCGATTGFSTQISVVNAGKQPSGSGNVLTADDDHGGAHAAPWGGPWAEFAWLSSSRLLVRYDSTARVFQRSEAVSGVQISFEPVVRR